MNASQFSHLPGGSNTQSPAWAILLVGLCYAGAFKGTPFFSRMSVDITLLLAAACLLGALVHVMKGSIVWRSARVLVGLWMLFSVGAINALWVDGGANKVLYLFTLTLLCAFCPIAFLTSQRSQRWLIWATVIGGSAMALAIVVWPDTLTRDSFGRSVLEGSNTIANARVVGASAVVAVLLAVTSGSKRWAWAILAVVLVALMVGIGSRGPFVSLMLAITAVIVLSKLFRGSKRVPMILLGACVLLLMIGAVALSGTRAAARLQEFLTGDSNDSARLFLLREGLGSTLANPLGRGWNGFSSIPSVARAYGGRDIYPHNLIVEVFVEGGWLAGIGLTVVVLIALRAFVRRSGTRTGVILLGLFVYWLLTAQTSSDVNGNRMTWVMIFLGVASAASPDSSADPALRHRELKV